MCESISDYRSGSVMTYWLQFIGQFKFHVGLREKVMHSIYLDSCRPLLGVPLQHVLHQGLGIMAGIGDQSTQAGWNTLGEAEVL